MTHIATQRSCVTHRSRVTLINDDLTSDELLIDLELLVDDRLMADVEVLVNHELLTDLVDHASLVDDDLTGDDLLSDQGSSYLSMTNHSSITSFSSMTISPMTR